MHGRVKVKAPAEIQAERAKAERAVALKFKEDFDLACSKRSNQCFDQEAFKITGRILLQNADHQTIWNYRREIILHWKDHGFPKENSEITEGIEEMAGDNLSSSTGATPSEMEKLCMDELKFTSSCLIKHPKSYATWFHRRFVISAMANPPFENEIQACDQFLDLDERNFHCWDYRRFICHLGKIDLKNELKFTQKKIGQNFSNFSSWYYRSSLLTLVHQEKILNINDVWDGEYETVSNAIFVDPNDQSPWFYHKWLLAVDQLINKNSTGPKSYLHKIIFDQTNSNMIYQFNKPLRESPFKECLLESEKGETFTLDNIQWKQIEPISSYIWCHQIENSISVRRISVKFAEENLDINLPDLDEESKSKIYLISEKPGINTTNPESKLDSEKLVNLNLLLEMEPNNKWINLTMALIKGGPDESTFNKLIEIDRLRRNYYIDQKSKQVWFNQVRDGRLNHRLSLTGRGLSCLYFSHDLTHLRYLNLTENHFLRLSKSFNNLVLLETLIMDKNQISMVDNDFKLLSLKSLSLRDNRFKSLTSLEPVKNCPLLETLDITNNTIEIQDSSETILPARIQIIIEKIV